MKREGWWSGKKLNQLLVFDRTKHLFSSPMRENNAQKNDFFVFINIQFLIDIVVSKRVRDPKQAIYCMPGVWRCLRSSVRD